MNIVKKLSLKKLPKKSQRIFTNDDKNSIGCWWVYTIRKIDNEIWLCTVVGCKIRKVEEGFKYIEAESLDKLFKEE